MQLFNGKQYLQIDIASNFGLDHSLWNERLDWFEANQHRLLELLPEAKEPALYYAGVLAWQEVLNGIPSGYPISLDATSSGLQILACLTGDRSAAQLCNVVHTGIRADAYTLLYEAMLVATGGSAKINRKDTKQAIMTAFYNSVAVPKQVFGEGKLLQIFFETLATHCPAAWELNECMLTLWNPEAHKHSWTLPDNFHVHVKVIDQVKETVHFLDEPFDVFKKVNQPTEEGRSLGANTIHSIDGMIVREMTRRCMYNPKRVNQVKHDLVHWNGEPESPTDCPDREMVEILWGHYEQSGYLSARILDYINVGNSHLVNKAVVLELIDSLPKKPFDLISVHDCFRCLPNYGNDLRHQYMLQLHLIAKSNMLNFLLSQLVGHQTHIGKLDETLADDILLGEYSLS
uniref:DNA-directed RNA polymerase n=1 Tax=Pseudomonas phage Arace01 TaxID=3138526 RepID=A0AAU6W081_9VIRU